MIEIVSATRKTQEQFWAESALGLSLKRLSFDPRLVVRIAFQNQRGLPEIYNSSIGSADGSEVIVFMHDDVWIDDYFFVDRIMAGLTQFDVIGLAGNTRLVKGQPAWAFLDDKLTWDALSNLSGSVAHGLQPCGPITYFGPVPRACELLDGVFLAARKAVLREHEVQFDPRFDFHHYDMDFCRRARQQGLRLGTWPICMTHQSEGAFGTRHWREKLAVYRQKWGE